MIAVALLAAGTLIVMVCSCLSAVVRDDYLRLHLSAPVASLGAPLIGVAVAVDVGWSADAVLPVVIALLVAVTAPAVQAVLGRACELHERADPRERT